jgi:hypothetical protein
MYIRHAFTTPAQGQPVLNLLERQPGLSALGSVASSTLFLYSVFLLLRFSCTHCPVQIRDQPLSSAVRV